jgi:integrase
MPWSHSFAHTGLMGRKLAPKAVPYAKTDGSTTWRVRLRVNGRQTTETFKTEVAANVFISRMLDPAIGPERALDLRDREDTRSSGYVPTVREALRHHVETITGVEDRTRADYLALAERSWLKQLGTLRVDEVERADIARWLNAATGAPKTIANAHSVLSATLNTAVFDGHIAANPARGVRLPRAGEEDEDDPTFLTHSEFDTLYRQVHELWRPMVIWMFGMGTRFSETTAAQERDLNLDAGRHEGDLWLPEPAMRVTRAWKQKPRRLGPPKSKAGKRSIVIPLEVLDVVEPLLTGTREGFVFRSRTGAAVTHSNFYNRIWKPATLKASICEDHRAPKCRCLAGKPTLCLVHTEKDEKGNTVLPEPCGCPGTLNFRPRIHDARHTHASWLIAQGIRLDVIQHRLGHEDYLTTQRLYGHLLPDAQAQAGAAASLAFAATALASGRTLALPGISQDSSSG